jgi:hypothetical protein
VIDKTDWGPQGCPGRQIGQNLGFGLLPELGNVGQVLMIDDDQQIIIREIAADRILDPVAPGIAAKEDDLE